MAHLVYCDQHVWPAATALAAARPSLVRVRPLLAALQALPCACGWIQSNHCDTNVACPAGTFQNKTGQANCTGRPHDCELLASLSRAQHVQLASTRRPTAPLRALVRRLAACKLLPPMICIWWISLPQRILLPGVVHTTARSDDCVLLAAPFSAADRACPWFCVFLLQ